jgi:hypothetical protein
MVTCDEMRLFQCDLEIKFQSPTKIQSLWEQKSAIVKIQGQNTV